MSTKPDRSPLSEVFMTKKWSTVYNDAPFFI